MRARQPLLVRVEEALQAAGESSRERAEREWQFEWQNGPDGADSGLFLLACASVLPAQGLYLGRGNCTARDGKEKVYSSIPERASQLKQVFVY